jgi:hypothetical protein
MANLFIYFDGDESVLKNIFKNILGRTHIYLPHAQTTIYDSKVKLFLKQGISRQLNRDAIVRFECENSAYLFFVFIVCILIYIVHMQGFQSGPVRGTFTRLRSCIVPAEITEPPKISGGQNHKYDQFSSNLLHQCI